MIKYPPPLVQHVCIEIIGRLYNADASQINGILHDISLNMLANYRMLFFAHHFNATIILFFYRIIIPNCHKYFLLLPLHLLPKAEDAQ